MAGEGNSMDTIDHNMLNLTSTSDKKKRKRSRSRSNKAAIDKNVVLKALHDGTAVLLHQEGYRSRVWSGVCRIKIGDMLVHNYVLCQCCQKLLAYGQGTTSNLQKHLEICDGNKTTSGVVVAKETKRRRTLPSKVAIEKVAQQRRKARSLDSKSVVSFHASKSEILKALTNASLDFILTDICPFSTISGEGFLRYSQALVNLATKYGYFEVSSNLPDEDHISGALVQANESLISKIKSICQKTDAYAIAIDKWTTDDNSNSYLGIMLHVISEEFNIRIINLGTYLLPDNSPATVRDIVDKVLETFHLSSANGYFVTNSANNFTGALSHVKRLDSCYHVLNQVVTCTIQNVPLLNDIVSQSLAVIRLHSKNPRYSAFSMKLKDYFISGCTMLLTMLHLLVDDFENVIQISRQLLCDEVDDDTSSVSLFCTKRTVEELQEVIDIFGAVKEAVDLVTDHKHATLHYVWPIFLSLSENYSVDQMEESYLRSEICKELLNQLKQQFVIQNVHKIASFLNPLTKDMSWLNKQERDNLQEEVLEMMRKISGDRAPVESSSLQGQCDIDQVHASTQQQATAGLNLAKFFFGRPSTSTKGVDEELLDYVDSPKTVSGSDIQYDIINHWRTCTNYPTLQKLARRILTTPASCTSCSLLFDRIEKMSSVWGIENEPEKLSDRLFISYNNYLTN